MSASETRQAAVSALIAVAQTQSPLRASSEAALVAAHSAINAALVGVAENTITAQQVTDLNTQIGLAVTAAAALVSAAGALQTAISAANVGLRTE